MKYLLIISLFLAMTSSGLSQTYNTIKETSKYTIDSIYNEFITTNEIAGASIAIVDNGKIVYSQGYGFSDLENQIKASDNTIFRIGSCTKSFTAMSIMQLQDAGKLNVNDPITNYIEELSMLDRFSKKNDLIIRDILTHTSGLPGDVLNGSFCDAPATTNLTILELNKQTFAAPNAYQLSYSNVGFELLGEVIARLSKQSYAEYLETNIFSPIGMKSSYVLGTTPIGYIDKKPFVEPLIRDQSAGLIHSNAIDMGNYLMLLLNRGKIGELQVLSAPAILEMEKNQIEDVLFNYGSKWGYGLYKKMVKIESEKDTTLVEMIGHGGDTWVFHADIKYIPELGIAAIIMTNTDKGARVTSAANLLKTYVELEKDKNLNLRVPKDKNTNLVETIPSESEIKGFYGVSTFPVIVENTDVIKFKTGFGKAVLNQKNDSMIYTGKINLFRIIPIKLKQQEFKFVKINGEVFLKNINVNSQQGFYEGRRLNLNPIPDEWAEMIGKYKAINDFACTDCPAKVKQSTLKLSKKEGMLFFEVETTGWVKGACFIEIIGDGIAVTDGIGRGTGETVKILENGNLYYSGYEFSKK
ncbi:serine hydrolase domain-containing protein [Crocinitomix catalasitica]|uniref:serine hydrolase domain-containing protein n=1 Tax=Crocinitomix catalasitica TaxID=184607 RepID=UPI000481CE44|nr:serine hydrolase domain-containing protein [Crocinitomix catalasitica]